MRHRRFLPRSHRFGYRLFMLYLDLDELEQAFRGRWLWSVERRNVASFRRRDFLGDPEQPLAEAVRERAMSALGHRPAGPVRMLTHLRYLGYCFNPVTFYYCFAACGTRVEAIVAEITNTPWGERHAYVLIPEDPSQTTHRFRFSKDFHVSPFMAMDHDYEWSFSTPGEQLAVHMENRREGALWFDASLSMQRRPLNGRSLASVLLRHPFMTGKVIAAIHWQALWLWLKRVPVHPHPRRLTTE